MSHLYLSLPGSNDKWGAVMKPVLWYPFWLSDYEIDTMDLTMLQHGAYRLLIDLCYKLGGSIPDDPRFINARLKAETKWEKKQIREMLRRYFVLTPENPKRTLICASRELKSDSKWEQKRISVEIQKAQERIEKARRAAYSKHARSRLQADSKQSLEVCNSQVKTKSLQTSSLLLPPEKKIPSDGGFSFPPVAPESSPGNGLHPPVAPNPNPKKSKYWQPDYPEPTAEDRARARQFLQEAAKAGLKKL